MLQWMNSSILDFDSLDKKNRQYLDTLGRYPYVSLDTWEYMYCPLHTDTSILNTPKIFVSNFSYVWAALRAFIDQYYNHLQDGFSQ